MPLGRLFSRRRRYDDLSVSIQEHLEEKIDELMEEGMSREEALHAVRRVNACWIGNIDHYHCAERFQIEARFRKLQLGVVGELIQNSTGTVAFSAAFLL